MSKFCGKCGAMINDDKKFCPNCGNMITSNQMQSHNHSLNNQDSINQFVYSPKPKKTKKPKQKMSKGKKAKIILILILVFVIAIVISTLTLFFTGSSHDVYKSMKSQNYSKALSEYEDEVSNDFIQKMFVKFALRNHSEEITDMFNNGKISYDTACEGLKALEQMGFGDSSDLINQITEVNASNTAIDKGNDYYENGDYENAIKEYAKISDTNKNYETAQTKLKDIYPKYISEITANAKEMSTAGNYEQAVSLINTALGIIPDSIDKSPLTSAHTEIINDYKSQVINNATSLINEKKFIEAIALINNSIDIDDNEDFQKTKKEAVKKYVEDINTTVENDLKNEDYISASRAVSSALEILPDNADLKALKTKVDNATPTYLLDVIVPYSTSGYEEYINGETFKMGGKEYTNGFTLNADGGNALFNIEGKYTSLSFNIGHCDETDMRDSELKIYCDGVLKTTKKIDKEALPQKISVDLTGVKQIKFELSGGGWNICCYGFGNLIVK